MFALIGVMTLLLASVQAAGQLWDNGDTDGTAYLSYGQFSSTLDDFYVPGGGWWVTGLETIGFYVESTRVVQDVTIFIWPHDYKQNAPDPDSGAIIEPDIISFAAAPTGRVFFDREELKITVNLEDTFLEGQEYYWVVMRVSDQYGHTDFQFLARQGVSHQPAWLRIDHDALVPQKVDASFALYGRPVQSWFRHELPIKIVPPSGE
jgi:hypothetical protein